jgi:hypothetical protein
MLKIHHTVKFPEQAEAIKDMLEHWLEEYGEIEVVMAAAPASPKFVEERVDE